MAKSRIWVCALARGTMPPATPMASSSTVSEMREVLPRRPVREREVPCLAALPDARRIVRVPRIPAAAVVVANENLNWPSSALTRDAVEVTKPACDFSDQSE
jgi:hypothetical protein